MNYTRKETKLGMKGGGADASGSRTEEANPEGKITSLLQLRAKLEQEVRADTRKLEDLKREVEMKLAWMHHLDEILSEASFQPASALMGDFLAAQDGPEPDHGPVAAKDVTIELKSFNEPVNIKDARDGTIYATLNFMQGNILIMLSQALHVVPESRVFQDIFQRHIVAVFEREGGKIFLERDDTGILRMITIAGSFKAELKEQIIKRTAQVVVQFREALKES
ncbi:MAG: hypothetical protein JW839_03155 [Candidatus Lokiarchaeota archaeon]|nr:hypothetical protein [Candidatus Lokiarchaeota archaeon]